MRSVTFAALLVLGLSATGATAPPRHKRARPGTHTVRIEQMRFVPESIVVAPGDTIVWVNEDLVPHTATSKTGGFDSRMIQTNGSWKYIVEKKGSYSYTCSFHPTMVGRLRVK